MKMRYSSFEELRVQAEKIESLQMDTKSQVQQYNEVSLNYEHSRLCVIDFKEEILWINNSQVDKNMECTILKYMNIIAFSQMSDDLAVLKIIITRMSKETSRETWSFEIIL